MMSQQPPSTKTNPLSSQDLPQGPLPPALQPPLLGQLLLEWVLPEALQEPVLGDLQEEFLEKSNKTLHEHAGGTANKPCGPVGIFYIKPKEIGLCLFLVCCFLSVFRFGSCGYQALIVS